MTFKPALMIVFAAVALGFSLAACELNESCDPEVDENCVVSDTGGDTGVDTPDQLPQFQTYHYVLIEDLDENASGDRPGADIDGIGLSKGGAEIYLSEIHENFFGGEVPTGANSNWNNALGQPQGQCVGESPGDWDPTTFVSLGGVGGYFTASFAGLAEIETGDDITVYACTGGLSEDWDLSVGVGSTLTDPNWTRVIASGVATVTITVPNLPEIPVN